jgi:ribosome biogenesis SPOUT family RNA methylase Rps3
MPRTALVIEHCEPDLSEWLMLEYRHAAKTWAGDVVFSCITEKKTASALRPLGKVDSRTPKEIFDGKRCLVLDPAAKQPLATGDFESLDGIIVGGILGYEKPQGWTKKLISDRYGFDARNLGNIQLSIDGAVFVARAVSLGLSLSDIEIAKEIEIVHDSCHSTVLPFGYPVIDGKPIITPGLIEYLSKN